MIKLLAALLLAAIWMFLVCSLLPAQDKPRAINFTVVLVGPTGDKILRDSAKDSPALTLGDAAMSALEAVLPSDPQNEGWPEKYSRDLLARKLYGKRAVVLQSEEIALIKKRIGILYGALVVGAAIPLLDLASVPTVPTDTHISPSTEKK